MGETKRMTPNHTVTSRVHVEVFGLVTDHFEPSQDLRASDDFRLGERQVKQCLLKRHCYSWLGMMFLPVMKHWKCHALPAPVATLLGLLRGGPVQQTPPTRQFAHRKCSDVASTTNLGHKHHQLQGWGRGVPPLQWRARRQLPHGSHSMQPPLLSNLAFGAAW